MFSGTALVANAYKMMFVAVFCLLKLVELVCLSTWSPIYKVFCDNAKDTIDLRWTSNLQNILQRAEGAIHSRNT